MSSDAIDVRLLTNEDLQVFDQVDDDVFDLDVRREFVEAFLAEPHSLIAVALENDVIVGMASAFTYSHPDKPLQMFINEVGVAGRCHRRGLGSALVKTLLDAARARGVAEAWVATETDNLPARGLYRSLGGIEDPSPAVVYTYDLRPRLDSF